MRLLVLAALAFAVLGTGVPARAEAPAAFARLRDSARPVESLSSFLEKYVGSCSDLLERPTCSANAKKARGEMTGKLHHLILDESAARMLKPGAFDPSNRQYRIDLTPFFEANGLALTDGAPKGQDAAGNPRIPLLPLYTTLKPDWMPMDVERLLRTGTMKVHLVFKPLAVWSLPGKGRDKIEGVRAKFMAVRLTDGRTGEDVALYVAD